MSVTEVYLPVSPTKAAFPVHYMYVLHGPPFRMQSSDNCPASWPSISFLFV